MTKALMVLDVQADTLGNRLDYIAPLCQRFLNNHGSEYEMVIFTYWQDPDEGARAITELNYEGAVSVGKSTYSGFTEEVQRLLIDASIDEVHLAGVDAEMAILATMFALVDGGYHVKILERLVAGSHGRNWEAMMIARHVVGKENVLNIGGGNVYM